MYYPYNAIFDRGLLNTFKATFHSAYLCLKVLASLRVISVFGSHKDARNIEQGFALGHKNVHFLREAPDSYQQDICPVKAEAPSEAKTVFET
jgi:hypothetical protein